MAEGLDTQTTDTAQLPASGATDVLSNPNVLTPFADVVQRAQVPATGMEMAPGIGTPGIGTLQTPTAPISGGATLGEILAAKGQTIPKPSPLVTKIGDAVGSALVSNPQMAKVPGGIMRTVVAGALEAMNRIGASLGDVAAVGQVPLGAGALTGLARTLQARQERLSREKRDQILNAEANIRLRRQQQLLHQADEEEINKSIAEGQKELDRLSTSDLPAQRVTEGTADDLRKLMTEESKMPLDQRTINPTTDIVLPTGRKVVNFDENGNPVRSTVYTVMKLPKEITLSDSPKDKQFLDEVKKYTGQDLKPGQLLTGAQYNFLRQQVNDIKTLETSRRIQLQKMDIEDHSSAQALAAVKEFNPSTQHAIIEALNQTGGDPLEAANILLQEREPVLGANGQPVMEPVLKDGKPVLGQNGQPVLAPRTVPKYPNIESDMKRFYGEEEWRQIRLNSERQAVKAVDQDAELEKKLITAGGQEAAAIASQIDEMLKDPALPSDRREKLTGWRDRAMAAARGSEAYEVRKTGAVEEAKRAVDEKDILTAAKNIVRDAKAGRPMTFRQIANYRGDQRTRLYNAIKEKDPDFNLAKLESAYKMYDDYTQGKTGQNLQSFGTFLEHAGAYSDAIHSISPNIRSKIANMTINQLRSLAGTNAEYQRALVALEPVQKEFEAFLLNNRALYQEDRDTVEKIINANLPIGAIEAALNQMGHTVQARYNEANRRFKNTVGVSIEDAIGPLDPEAIAGAEKIGLDRIGDTQLKPKQTEQQTKQQTVVASKPAKLQHPPGAVGIAPGPDGKMYYHDAQGRNLGLAPPELQ